MTTWARNFGGKECDSLWVYNNEESVMNGSLRKDISSWDVGLVFLGSRVEDF